VSAGTISTDNLIEALVALREARSVIGSGVQVDDQDLLKRLAKAEAGLRGALMLAVPTLSIGSVVP